MARPAAAAPASANGATSPALTAGSGWEPLSGFRVGRRSHQMANATIDMTSPYASKAGHSGTRGAMFQRMSHWSTVPFHINRCTVVTNAAAAPSQLSQGRNARQFAAMAATA